MISFVTLITSPPVSLFRSASTGHGTDRPLECNGNVCAVSLFHYLWISAKTNILCPFCPPFLRELKWHEGLTPNR